MRQPDILLRGSPRSNERLSRVAPIERGALDADTIELAFSSEAPVERYFGMEVLDHGATAVDLTALRTVGTVLFNHDRDRIVAAIDAVRVDQDRVARARIRFIDTPESQQARVQVEAGALRGVSVGYQVDEWRVEKSGSSETWRAVRWQPLEISLVSIPADQTVGVGRAGALPLPVAPERTTMTLEELLRLRDQAIAAGNSAEVTRLDAEISALTRSASALDQPAVASPAPAAVPAAAAPAARTDDLDAILRAERQRVSDIQSLATRHNRRDIGDAAIAAGLSIEQFRGQMLDAIGQRPLETNPTQIGLGEREARSYSLVRALRAAAANDWSIAPFERECSRAVEQSLRQAPNGFFIPTDALDAFARDLTSSSSAPGGGNLIGTELRPQNFIELLRNRMMVRELGAFVLDNLVGNVAIPKQTGGSQAYWVGEATPPTESEGSFGQVALSPKIAGTFTEFSRQLLQQSSPSVEQLVRNDLATALALGVDLAALHGTGSSNQPRGVANLSGLSVTALGTNGLAPTWASIVALETAVATSNADVGSLAYLTNAKVRGKLKGVEKAANTGLFVWEDAAGADRALMNGYRAAVSNQVSSTLTKGTASGICSAIFFGNWSDLLIGMWGGVDIQVNPYSRDTEQIIRATAFQTVDVQARRVESFGAILDALTT